MTSVYTPTATWHATITEIADSDSPTASNLNTSVEAIADNAKFLHQNATLVKTVTFSSAGTFTVGGSDVVKVTCFGYGGGGGGGAGSVGPGNAANELMPGGGGGAGAIPSTVVIDCPPGVYTVTIGAGGSAGGDGGATFITDSNPKLMAKWFGGAHGQAATDAIVVGSGSNGFVPGGSGPAGQGSYAPTSFNVTQQGGHPFLPNPVLSTCPGTGGAGIAWSGTTGGGDPGGFSMSGYPGSSGGTAGPGGTQGALSGSLLGGGGGGGGGGCWDGQSTPGVLGRGYNGGAGGNGGAANGSGGSTGGNGTVGADNSGAGGGGGGSAGACTGTGTPGTGAAGGSGFLVVQWFENGVHT